jgi:hypothetical protein
MRTHSKARMMTSAGVQRASAEQRLTELGIKLPAPPEPFGTYAEAVQTGDLLFLSGMLPTEGHSAKFVGRLGAELDVEAGRKAAHLATLNVLAVAPGADFEIVEREIPEPGPGQVRIRVQACGVCHSDVLTKEGSWPGIQYPRVPGHEVAGITDEVGAGVLAWKKGQRVGVGWHGGQDNTCRECRRGDFRNCRNLKICGISYDGGYQQYMVAPVEALVPIPESLSDIEAAPLLCAGNYHLQPAAAQLVRALAI